MEVGRRLRVLRRVCVRVCPRAPALSLPSFSYLTQRVQAVGWIGRTSAGQAGPDGGRGGGEGPGVLGGA